MSEVCAGQADLASLFASMLPPSPVEVEPEIDVAAIAAAAHAAGFADGLSEGEARIRPARDAFIAAAAALDAATTIDAATLRPVFVDLVTRLAETVVMAELALSPAVVDRLVAAALGAIDRAATSLRLHPDDAARLAHTGVELFADPDLTPGTIVVEGADFVVRDGLAERLAAVLADLA